MPSGDRVDAYRVAAYQVAGEVRKMTRYIMPIAHHGSIHAIGDGRTYDDSYSVKPGAAASVWSGKATCVQSFGKCRTPHAVNVEQRLVNGWCVTCLANGAEGEE